MRIGVAQRGSRVTLTVEDSGPGIPAADRHRLFDRFHRATEQGGGAGLGLAIADSIVRSTGGHWRIGDSRSAAPSSRSPGGQCRQACRGCGR